MSIIGVILNGHRPLHNGHVFMIEFAKAYVDKLYIGVCTLDSEPFNKDLKYKWTKDSFPGCEVILCHNMPKYFGLDYNDPILWGKVVKEHMGLNKVDYFFASEDYGTPISEQIGAKFIPVDPLRNTIPISGTTVRNNPMLNWEFIPSAVRPYFLKRFCFYGFSNSFISQIAKRYNTYFSSYPINYESKEDLLLSIKANIASETALSKLANKILLCTIDPILIPSYCETYRIDLSEKILDKNINELINKINYDRYFINNIGYLTNKTRVDILIKNLIEHKRNYVVTQGNDIQAICLAIDDIVSKHPTLFKENINEF